MTIVNASTKRGMGLIQSAMNNEGTTLNQVYGRASYAKQQALNHCLMQCVMEGGRNFRITSHNTFSFSVAWETAEGLRIETSRNSYLVK